MLADEEGRCAAMTVLTLIVDDDFYAREALRALLVRDGRTRVWDAVADVSEAVEAISVAAAKAQPMPGVIVLDVRLHGRERGGIEGLPELRSASPESRVLVVSMCTDPDVVIAALEAGADGYLWKNESADGIADAVERAAAGRLVLTRSIAERIAGEMADVATQAADVLPERRVVALTDSVRRTVYLYCVCGMSAREIADELQLSVNTVNSRLRTAFQVLGAGSRREAFAVLVTAEEAESR